MLNRLPSVGIGNFDELSADIRYWSRAAIEVDLALSN